MSSIAATVDLGIKGIQSTIRIKRSKRFAKLPRLLSTHQLSEYWVFRGATVEVDPGDVLMVIADDPLMATTFLRSLCALLPADEGLVKGDSRSVMITRVRPNMLRRLSVRQTVLMLAGFYGLTDREIDERFDAVVKMAEISRKLNEPIDDHKILRMQIMFSIAILAPADLLAFDETALIGEKGFRDKCPSRLEAVRDQGRALVIATKNIALVRSLGSKAIILDESHSRSVSIDEAVAHLQKSKGKPLRKKQRPDEEEPEDDAAAF